MEEANQQTQQAAAMYTGCKTLRSVVIVALDRLLYSGSEQSSETQARADGLSEYPFKNDCRLVG